MTKLVLPPRPGRLSAVPRATSAAATSAAAATGATASSATAAAARSAEEPRTGVVRKAVLPDASRANASGIRPSLKLRRARAWRCLEADPRQPAERASGEALVSTAQLSFQGERLRHSGPHEWLPDATEFVHRASHLIARGLGFELCRGVCLQGPAAVFSVSLASSTTVVGVAGPARPLTNVLRQRGLR